MGRSKAGKQRKAKDKCGTYTDYNASCVPNDTYGTIFSSMLYSKQFQALSIGAKMMYVYCRNQAQEKKAKASLILHGNEEGYVYPLGIYFVFPAKHMERYGQKRSNGCKYLKELIDAGFIEKVECNKHRKKENVYMFSSKWKEREV